MDDAEDAAFEAAEMADWENDQRQRCEDERDAAFAEVERLHGIVVHDTIEIRRLTEIVDLCCAEHEAVVFPVPLQDTGAAWGRPPSGAAVGVRRASLGGVVAAAEVTACGTVWPGREQEVEIDHRCELPAGHDPPCECWACGEILRLGIDTGQSLWLDRSMSATDLLKAIQPTTGTVHYAVRYLGTGPAKGLLVQVCGANHRAQRYGLSAVSDDRPVTCKKCSSKVAR